MLINTVTPHVANGLFIILEGCMRCKDRGCTCNRRKTKKLLQEDYEDINTGSEFLLEHRYSQLLTTIFMIFMYSSGIPLLYLIAVISFIFTYWFDKLFCKFIIQLITFDSTEMPEKATLLHFTHFLEDSYHNEIQLDPTLCRRSLHVHQQQYNHPHKHRLYHLLLHPD